MILIWLVVEQTGGSFHSFLYVYQSLPSNLSISSSDIRGFTTMMGAETHPPWLVDFPN